METRKYFTWEKRSLNTQNYALFFDEKLGSEAWKTCQVDSWCNGDLLTILASHEAHEILEKIYPARYL